MDRKYDHGSLGRATGQGYRKSTGKDRPAYHKNSSVRMKKRLIFREGRAPDGKRTDWVMHEYRLSDAELEKIGVSQDTFALCRIYQKSGLGRPNSDRYAPLNEEECDEDTPLTIPGVESDDELVNGNEARKEGSGFGQNLHLLGLAASLTENLIDPPGHQFVCKRDRSDGLELLSSSQSKQAKYDDPQSSHANGSACSAMTGKDNKTVMMTKNSSSTVLQFPLLEPKEHQAMLLSLDSFSLEKSVPPGFLRVISNLENKVFNASMERETLKNEVMRAKTMITALQSCVNSLTKENEDLRRKFQQG